MPRCSEISFEFLGFLLLQRQNASTQRCGTGAQPAGPQRRSVRKPFATEAAEAAKTQGQGPEPKVLAIWPIGILTFGLIGAFSTQEIKANTSVGPLLHKF